MPIVGKVDNESLRIAVAHGYSPRMSGHMKQTTNASIQFLRATTVHPKHCPGTENRADMLTISTPFSYGIAFDETTTGEVEETPFH